MFGLGMGRGGNPKMRYIRLGLFAMIILAGIIFHHSGKTYETIRVFYYIVIVGFVLFAMSSRRRLGQNSPYARKPREPWNRPVNGQQNPGPFQQGQPVQAPIETRLVEKETPDDSPK